MLPFKATNETIRNTKTNTVGYVISRWTRRSDNKLMVDVWVPSRLRPVIWQHENTEAA